MASVDVPVALLGYGTVGAAVNRLLTDSADDIERATALARKMVCEWGMSEKLGPVTFGQKQESIFLGRDITRHQDYSEATSRDIDQEVRGIVIAAYERAKTLLETNLNVLHRVAKTLLEKEVVDGAEIQRIIQLGNSPEGPADAPEPAGAPA